MFDENNEQESERLKIMGRCDLICIAGFEHVEMLVFVLAYGPYGFVFPGGARFSSYEFNAQDLHLHPSHRRSCSASFESVATNH